MINEKLHKTPVALDRMKHRALRLDRSARDLSRFSQLNAFFVSASEFGEACKDCAIVWINAGADASGKALVAPVAVFGLQPNQNLCIEADQWRVRYVPAMLRFYPFAMARTSETDIVLCVDESWQGLGTEAGEPLFNPDGSPSEFTLSVQQQLQQFEVDVERTRGFGARLMELGLLRDMRFDATLPDGQKLEVDGFFTIDETKLAKLSDAEVLELARGGMLGLIHAHQISLANMTRLAEWQAVRQAAAAESTPVGSASTAPS